MSAVDDAKHCGTKGLERLGLEFWPIERLVPPRNARIHSDAQVAEIAGSIRAFGFTNPILVGELGDVIAGHCRLAAARLLGLAEVPVIPLRGLSDVQRRLVFPFAGGDDLQRAVRQGALQLQDHLKIFGSNRFRIAHRIPSTLQRIPILARIVREETGSGCGLAAPLKMNF